MIAFPGPCYPLESAASVIAGMREFAERAPDEVNVSATWWTIPPLPDFPGDLHGRAMITVGAIHVGAPEKGERILQPLREIEEPLLDLSGILPYVALQQMFDPFFPAHDLHYYWKAAYLADLGEEATQTIAEHVAARPSAMSMVGTWALDGALARADADAGVAGVGGASYLLEILANWADPAEAEANIEWTHMLFDAMRPYGTGRTIVNFPGAGRRRRIRPGRVRRRLGPAP